MPYTCIQRVLSVFSPLECQSAYNSARDAVNQRILKSDWLRIIQKWRELSGQKHNSFISWMSTPGHIWKIRILRDIGFAKETTLRKLIFEEINFREVYFRGFRTFLTNLRKLIHAKFLLKLLFSVDLLLNWIWTIVIRLW